MNSVSLMSKDIGAESKKKNQKMRCNLLQRPSIVVVLTCKLILEQANYNLRNAERNELVATRQKTTSIPFSSYVMIYVLNSATN